MRRRARTGRRGVLVVGPVPPPVHGAARVTELVLGELRAVGADVVFRDTSAADDAPWLLFLLDRLRIHLQISGLLLTRRRIGTVYFAGAARGGLWFQLIVAVTARLVGARVFFHHHSFAPLRRTDAGMRALVAVAGVEAEHIALCPTMARRLRERYPRVARVRVCSNAGLLEPAGEPPAAPTASRGDGDVVLGHLSNLFVDKGLDVVVETMRQARAAGLPVRLLLAGRCLSAEAEALVAELLAQFPDRVDYRGPIPSTAVPAFLDEVDVFVFPSRFRNEAEPLVVLEAARAGAPTVAYDVGCLAGMVRDPGVLVPLDGNLPAAVLDLVRHRERLDRSAVAADFVRDRTAATAARDELIADLRGAGSAGPGPATVVVEADPDGHRFHAAGNVARLAARTGPVQLLTSRGAAATPEFAAYLADADVTVHEVFDTAHPSTREVVTAVAAAVRVLDDPLVMVMDADAHLKRWWYLAPRALRGHRARVHFMLTRYPARLALDDRTSVERRVSKALLVSLTRATGTLHHVAGFAGRDDMSRGWLVRRARDPAECSAHARDRVALREQLGLPQGVPIVGIFGVIDDRRNAPLVLAAMRRPGFTEALLLLAGRVAPEVRAWLDGLPAAERARVVVIDEWLDNDRMDRLVAAVDVAPVPLALNGPSGIMGKALAAGVPVVTAGSTVRAREVAATGGGEAVELTEDGLAGGLRRALDRDPDARSRSTVPLATAEEFAAALLNLPRG